MSALQVLKVDVDVPVSMYDYRGMFEKRVEILKRLGYQVEDARLEFSSSGEHVHYIIVLRDPLPTARDVYDLQMLLGDDQKRCTYNYVRYRVMGDASLHFNVLFAKKVKISRLEIFRHKMKRMFHLKRNDGGKKA